MVSCHAWLIKGCDIYSTWDMDQFVADFCYFEPRSVAFTVSVLLDHPVS